MDSFTFSHLKNWTNGNLDYNERDSFETWLMALYENDPEFVSDAGWPFLYEMFRQENTTTAS